MRHFLNLLQRRIQIEGGDKTKVSLCDIHGLDLPHKVVYLAKQVFMDFCKPPERPNLKHVQQTLFKQFQRLLLTNPLLRSGKLRRVGDTQLVLQGHAAYPPEMDSYIVILYLNSGTLSIARSEVDY